MYSLKTILQTIVNNLHASAQAYRQYMAAGKTFRYAQELKKYNSTVIELLTMYQHQFSPALQQDAAALLHHYQAWTSKWEALAAERNFQPDEVFVFENEVSFPKQAQTNLEAALAESE